MDGFDDFFVEMEPRLRRAYSGHLASSNIPDAVAAALGFAWANWERVSSMERPAAYLYRVGLSKSRGRRQGRLPASPPAGQVEVEPRLVKAMQQLPRRQREVVWLVDGCHWTVREAAEALDVSPSAVRTHRERGLASL